MWQDCLDFGNVQRLFLDDALLWLGSGDAYEFFFTHRKTRVNTKVAKRHEGHSTESCGIAEFSSATGLSFFPLSFLFAFLS